MKSTYHSIDSSSDFSLKGYNPNRDMLWLLIRPWIWIPRVLKISILIILFALKVLVNGSNKQINTQKDLAKSLLATLTELGPCFIKVGQALSTRPDLVNQVWLDELTNLQDNLPPFSHEEAVKIIKKELGDKAIELFTYFPDKPIASASLGQVYKANLHNDYWVAVKVQRPNLKTIIRRDLVIIKTFGVLIAPFLPLNLGFSLGEIIDEFGKSLFEEIDYDQEALNAEKFAFLFIDNDNVSIPLVEKTLSSSKIITTSWVKGLKLKDQEYLKENGYDPNAIIRTAVISGIQQLLEFGYFHADPHPGNMFAIKDQSERDGKIAYVDFGMMDSISNSDRITLTGAIVHLINKDFNQLAKDFQKLGFLSKSEDINKLTPVLEDVLGEVLDKEVESFNLKSVTDKFSSLMFNYPFRVPARFALIIRAVVSQEGLALKLDPSFKIINFAYPYVARRLLTDQSDEMINILMDIIFDKNGSIRVDRIEALLDVIVENSTSDSNSLIPVARDSIKLLIGNKGSNIRKKILLSLIKNERINTKDIKSLLRLIKNKFNPKKVANNFINRVNPLSA